MKIAIFIIHYYNKDGIFKGKSTRGNPAIRKMSAERTIEAARNVKGADVFVCGFPGSSLVDIDIDASKINSDPRLISYETLASLRKYSGLYDYFAVVEDDILINGDTFGNIIHFDRHHDARAIFLPNRIEVKGNIIACVDTDLNPNKTDKQLTYRGRTLRVYENPNSSIFIVNAEKLEIIKAEVDHSFRGLVVGGPMASAMAHFHKPFDLYRVDDGLDFHTVQHLDVFDTIPPKRTLIQRAAGKLRRLVSSTAAN